MPEPLLHCYPGAHSLKQAPEFLLPKGLDSPCLQQLLWLLIARCQKTGLRALIACRLGSTMSVPTAAAMAPTQEPLMLCEQQTILDHWLCFSVGTLNLLLSARSPLPHT
jgi:hypothetical protein